MVNSMHKRRQLNVLCMNINGYNRKGMPSSVKENAGDGLSEKVDEAGNPLVLDNG